MIYTIAVRALLVSIPCLLLTIAFLFGRVSARENREDPLTISLNSKCPACGHRGCKLETQMPQLVEIGEKRQTIATEPLVKRICLTCGAFSYEKPVLDWAKWVKK